MSSIDKKAFGISDSLINAVNEALKGGQVKIDKNHNGKIDGQDFKMLRKEEVVDEGNPANKEKKNAAAAAVGAKNKDSQYLTRINPSVADKIRGREKMSGNDRKQFEEVEQVDELSKATMGSYIKKSTASAADAARRGGVADAKKAPSFAKSAYKTLAKRTAGIAKATDKLTKEDVQIDELSTDTYHSAAHKAAKRAMGDAQGRSGPIFKKYAGMANKFRDKGMSQEKKEKAMKEAYDDNSSNVGDWSDKKLKWHKEKLSSSSAKAHSELVRRSKTGQAAPKKTNEEVVDEERMSKGRRDALARKTSFTADPPRRLEPEQKKTKSDKMKAYRADRDKHMEEATDPRDSRPQTYRPNNTGYAWDKLSTRSSSNPKDSKATKSGKQLGLKHSIKGALGSHGPKGKLPEETDPGFVAEADNAVAKQIAAKKDAFKTQLQQKIAAKQMNTMQAKANKRLSNINASNDKCTCQEGKGKNMTCEMHGDTKKLKGGKEPIEINPPLREAQVKTK